MKQKYLNNLKLRDISRMGLIYHLLVDILIVVL